MAYQVKQLSINGNFRASCNCYTQKASIGAQATSGGTTGNHRPKSWQNSKSSKARQDGKN
jgi:hypothetical protein